MLDCLILGDSLAVGVGQARPGCDVVARVGINSSAYLHTLFATVRKAASSVVISLGVNDDPAMNTLDNLRRLRTGLQATQVTWLLPGLKDNVRRAIQTVAAEHRDRLVDTKADAGADHLHPTAAGYRHIAAGTEASPTELARAPSVFHPVFAANPPQFLPMLQVPAVHPSLQGGGLFRSWVPTGLRSFAFRMYPAVVTR